MGTLKKKLVIIGRAASGKTTLKDQLCQDWKLRPEVSYTSRPPRFGEVNGRDYWFVDKSGFERLIAEGKMLQHDFFNGNYYGTSLEEFNNSDVMIMTPSGLINASRVRSVLFVIYVYAPHTTILERLSARHNVSVKADMDLIRERIAADNIQFKDFEKRQSWDIEVDSSMPINLMISNIKNYINIFGK